jgi:hypothetical protein
MVRRRQSKVLLGRDSDAMPQATIPRPPLVALENGETSSICDRSSSGGHDGTPNRRWHARSSERGDGSERLMSGA